MTAETQQIRQCQPGEHDGAEQANFENRFEVADREFLKGCSGGHINCVNENVQALFFFQYLLGSASNRCEVAEVDCVRDKVSIGEGDVGKVVADAVYAAALADELFDKSKSERSFSSGDNCNVHKMYKVALFAENAGSRVRQKRGGEFRLKVPR